jgi:hypothetical protein
VKNLTLLAICACGLSMAASAHASSHGLGDQLVSAEDHLISAVTNSLNAGSNAADASSSDDAGVASTNDTPSAPHSVGEPSGDLFGLPSESTHKSGGATHRTDAHETQALGWQSLLPGSIQ